MNEDSDEALMIAYAGGDARAFETLYARFRRPLYGYFRRHVGDPATANDLYQGCWEKVITARRRYDRRAPFRAWLFRIAHNHLVDHYRGQRDTAPLPPEIGPAAPHDPDGDDAPEAALDEALEQRRRTNRFRAAVNALPPDQRDAISLRIDGGLALADIARVTGVGVETAKSRLRYATRTLKEALQS